MIMLTIGGATHQLSVKDAKNLALAIAAEVDKPGQGQRFNGSRTAFSVEGVTTTTGRQPEVETFSRDGITLTNC